MSQEFFPTITVFDPKEVMKWIQFAMAILPLFGIAFPPLAPAIVAFESLGRGGIDVVNTFMPIP